MLPGNRINCWCVLHVCARVPNQTESRHITWTFAKSPISAQSAVGLLKNQAWLWPLKTTSLACWHNLTDVCCNVLTWYVMKWSMEGHMYMQDHCTQGWFSCLWISHHVETQLGFVWAIQPSSSFWPYGLFFFLPLWRENVRDACCLSQVLVFSNENAKVTELSIIYLWTFLLA